MAKAKENNILNSRCSQLDPVVSANYHKGWQTEQLVGFRIYGWMQPLIFILESTKRVRDISISHHWNPGLPTVDGQCQLSTFYGM